MLGAYTTLRYLGAYAALLCLTISGCLFADPGVPANETGEVETSQGSEDSGSTGSPTTTTEPQPTEDTGAPSFDCTWEKVVTEPRPAKRIDAALSLAPGGAEVLLYGGRLGLMGPDLADTWLFDGERWRLLVDDDDDKKEQPGPRRGHTMAYDAARDRVLLFGGEYGSLDPKLAGHTWTHDGVGWTRHSGGPSPRTLAAMADLPAKSVVVLFGGRTAKDANAETWAWNGQDWAELEVGVAPSPRFGHLMTLDGSGDLLLYGGCGDLLCGEPLDDTWRFDGEGWERLDTGATDGLRSGGMVHNTAQAQTLRFGEGSSWRWTGTAWSPANAAEPALGYFTLTELPGTGVVLFGGLTSKAIESDETWVLGCL